MMGLYLKVHNSLDVMDKRYSIIDGVLFESKTQRTLAMKKHTSPMNLGYLILAVSGRLPNLRPQDRRRAQAATVDLLQSAHASGTRIRGSI